MPSPARSHSPDHIHTGRMPTPLVFVFVAVSCFVLGLLFALTLSPHLDNMSLSSTISAASMPYRPSASRGDSAGTATARSAVAATDAPPVVLPGVDAPSPEEPLGMRWLHAGHDNPWSFSVQRHTIAEMHETVQRKLNATGQRLPRVAVCLTTLPRRLGTHGANMLRIISGQRYLPDVVYVSVPRESRRSNESYALPSWLTSHPLVTVLRPKIDYGPATKLIPALRAELALGHADTRLVTVDDDDEGRWLPNTLLFLFAYSLHFDDAAIGLTGWNATCMVGDARCGPHDSGLPLRQFPNRMYNFVRQAEDMACHTLADWLPDYYANCMGAVRKNHVGYVDVLEGYKGVVYQPRFFKAAELESIVDKSAVPEYFMVCDDVWFSGWLSMRKVPRLVVSPAIHEDSLLYQAMHAYGTGRKLPKVEDRKYGTPGNDKPERGLHELGNFVQANHDGVRWFEEKGGWVKDLWKRPAGYLYPSERAGHDGN